jgi:hypothetical protein
MNNLHVTINSQTTFTTNKTQQIKTEQSTVEPISNNHILYTLVCKFSYISFDNSKEGKSGILPVGIQFLPPPHLSKASEISIPPPPPHSK